MFNRIKTIFNLYPDKCPFCEEILEHYDYACEKCKQLIPDEGIHQGVAFGHKCVSSLFYNGIYRKSVLRFKFKGKTQFASQFAQIMYAQIKCAYPDMIFDCITYVPVHRIVRFFRGYNQCELLANELSKLMKIPPVETLKKIKHTTPQHKIDAKNKKRKCIFFKKQKQKSRKTNLIGAFRVIDKEKVKDKHILLLDDIITTGSTLSECIKTLNKAKPQMICCVTLLSAGSL